MNCLIFFDKLVSAYDVYPARGGERGESMSKKKKKNPKKSSQQNRKKQPSNIPAIVFFSVCGVLIIAILIMFAVNPNSDQETANSYEFDYEGQPAIGDDDAPIKMVEFGDYKCPACKRFDETVFPQLQEEFIDSGKVQFFFINYPFIGDDSFTAAEVGEAVLSQDEDAFWSYHHLVYENQESEQKRWATMNRLRTLIEEHLPSIDVDQLESDMDNRTFQSAVEEDLAIVQNAGVTGTPTIFINGTEFADWSDYNAIRDELNRILEQDDNGE